MRKEWIIPAGAIVNGTTLTEPTAMYPCWVQIGDVQYEPGIFEYWTEAGLALLGITPAPEPPAPVIDTAEARRCAFVLEADPLFFRWQRGEGTKEEWVAKVEEIRARFPVTQPA